MPSLLLFSSINQRFLPSNQDHQSHRGWPRISLPVMSQAHVRKIMKRYPAWISGEEPTKKEATNRTVRGFRQVEPLVPPTSLASLVYEGNRRDQTLATRF